MTRRWTSVWPVVYAVLTLVACGGSSDSKTDLGLGPTGPSDCGYNVTSTQVTANVGDTVTLQGTFTNGLHYHVWENVHDGTRDVPVTVGPQGVTFVMPKVYRSDFRTDTKQFWSRPFLLNDRCENGVHATQLTLIYKPVFQYQGTFHLHQTLKDSINDATFDVTTNATLQSQLGTRRYADSQSAPGSLLITWSASGTEKAPYAKSSQSVVGGGVGTADSPSDVFVAIDPERDTADIQLQVVKKNGVTLLPGPVLEDFSVATPSVFPHSAEAKMDGLTILGGSFQDQTSRGTVTLEWPTMVPTQVHCTGTNGNSLTNCTPVQ